MNATTMELEPRDLENVVISDTDVQKIVLSYLVHNCFKETAEAFISGTGLGCTVEYFTDFEKIKVIYNSTMEGNILKAMDLTKQLAPELLQNDKDVLFEILTLHFVELVRARKCLDALEFAQRELAPFGKLGPYVEKLQDFLTLLAYEEPEKSPMFELLSMDHRQTVSDALQHALLAQCNLPSYTPMERIIQQITVVRQRLSQELGKDDTTPFSLKAFLKS